MSRNWKRIVPTTLIDAFRLCKDYAREKRNLSVERIAELMGVTADVLYKWLANGRMPAILIPVYELACGIDFVSRHLAVSGGRLVLDMPSGRHVKPTETYELQTALNDAVGAVLAFAAGSIQAEEALAIIDQGLGNLAWHRGNVAKADQPELELAP